MGGSMPHSRRAGFCIAIGALLLLSASARAEQKKLAVLQFEVQKGLEIDRQTFSARLQNEARRAAPDLFVMTQANIETLVRAAGKTLEQCEGQCAVDTGKLIGADLVISGRIARVGRTYAISMQLYNTASGELLEGEDVTAKTEDELLAVSAGAAQRLLQGLGGAPTAASPRAVPNAGTTGILKILSTPAGARVLIDGEQVTRSVEVAAGASRHRAQYVSIGVIAMLTHLP